MITDTFNALLDRQLALFDRARGERDMTAFDLRQGVHRYAQEIVRPYDDIAEKDDAFPHPLWKKLGDQGYKGLIVPKEYGGSGLGCLDLCVTTLEIARAAGAIAVSYVCDLALCTRQIATFGTEAQKTKYLPALVSGDAVGALAMSEPNAGSDVMSMKTTATKVDGGYVINGSKLWSTNGVRIDPETGKLVTADTLVLYAKNKESKGLTTFILERGMEGFMATGRVDKRTTNGSDTSILTFDNCFVPDENVLGQPGKGGHILMNGLNTERITFSANVLGVAMAALEETIDYTTQRRQFGYPLAYNQAMAHELSGDYARIEAALYHTFGVAVQADIDPKSLTNASAASAFLNATLVGEEATRHCVHHHGGNGQTTGYRTGRQHGVAMMFHVGAGAVPIRREVIAREIIPGYMQAQRSMAAALANGG